jgi:plastocyanin
MQRFLYLLTFLFFTLALQAQLVITEISYNPPESGNDSLEYIEIFNAGEQAIHLLKYKFTRGVDFTFPDINLAAYSYLVVCIKASAFQNVYGKTALQWTSGALNNNGERITIADSLNVEKADVTYSNQAPWPTAADGTNGEGRSVEICGPSADPNNGANWKVSENNLNIVINNKTLYGTPGAANSVAPCTPVADVVVEVSSFQFAPKDVTIDVGQTVRWENKGGTHNVNGSLAVFPNNPEGFFSGSPSADNWVFDYTFTKPGFYEYQCDLHVSTGMRGTVTVKEEVVTDPYPLRTIASLKSVDVNGVADSLNVKCRIEGIVYGINIRPGGIQFTVMDEQGRGIGVFNNANTLGYTVRESDRIVVRGTVAQFRGLTQMNADEISYLSTGHPLVAPKTVTQFVEEDESGLLVVRNVSFSDKSQWGGGTAAGFNVDMTNGQTVFSIRIDGDTDMFSMPVPDGNVFNVIGLLSQFSNNATPPYEGGYQLLPRYIADFAKVTSTQNQQILHFRLYPNPAMDYIIIEEGVQAELIQVYNESGHLMFSAENKQRLDVQFLPKGFYTINVKAEGKLHAATFIKL